MKKNVYTGYISSKIGFWSFKSDDEALLSVNFNKNEPSLKQDDHPIIKETADQLTQYFNKKRTEFDLPLGIKSYSAFYQEVWTALLKVEYGKTSTYSDLSNQINNPKAVRAVGMANGRNPIAIIIPCHRIIGKDNTLTGYASGLEVKKWLLEHEGAIAVQTSLF